jgi:hypothetical protein
MTGIGGRGGSGGRGGEGEAGEPGGHGGEGGHGGKGGDAGVPDYHPQKRIERALIVAVIVAVLAVSALAIGGIAFLKERSDARCFRDGQAHLSQVAAEDRTVTDALFEGFVYSLAHPSNQTVTQLLDDLHTYQAARAADDKERAAHPITGTC